MIYNVYPKNTLKMAKGGISSQPQFKLQGIIWRCWQAWVCTNRCAVNSSSHFKVNMQLSLLHLPRTMETNCGQWCKAHHHDLHYNKHVPLIKKKKNKNPRLKKVGDKEPAKPEPSTEKWLLNSIRERDDRYHLKSPKKWKRGKQNKTKKHAHTKPPSRILPSMIFLELHQWSSFQNTQCIPQR